MPPTPVAFPATVAAAACCCSPGPLHQGWTGCELHQPSLRPVQGDPSFEGREWGGNVCNRAIRHACRLPFCLS